MVGSGVCVCASVFAYVCVSSSAGRGIHVECKNIMLICEVME